MALRRDMRAIVRRYNPAASFDPLGLGLQLWEAQWRGPPRRPPACSLREHVKSLPRAVYHANRHPVTQIRKHVSRFVGSVRLKWQRGFVNAQHVSALGLDERYKSKSIILHPLDL